MKTTSNESSVRLVTGKAFALLMTVVAALGLVLGFWQPKAAKAETLSYDYVSEAEVGESYLIVSNGQALVNNNGSVGTVEVTISGDTVTVVGDADESSLLWTVGDDGSLKNDNYYVRRASGKNEAALTLNTETGEHYTNWSYTGEQLTVVGGSNGTSTYYIYYNSGWKTYTSTSYTAMLYGITDATPRVSVSPKTLSLGVGESSELTATIKNADGAEVAWSSSDESVATVYDGTVTGLKDGSATITASITVDEVVYSATCTVTVKTQHKYYLVDAPTAGKQYVIADGNEVGSSAHALGSSSSGADNVDVEVKSDVIKSGDSTVYVQGDFDDTSVWTVGEGITLQSSNGYLRYSNNSLSVSSTSSNWSYNTTNHTLSPTSSSSRYLRYNNSWGVGRTSGNIYFYELEEAAPEPTYYTVTFQDENGTEISSAQYAEGTAASDITVPAEPTKQATAEYTYVFAGWSDGTNTYASADLPAVTADVTYTATFSETVNQYTVTFVDEDGETVIKEATSYDYGTTVADIVVPADPTKEATADYTYEFAGWSDGTTTYASTELPAVTGNVTYTATYEATAREFAATVTTDPITCGERATFKCTVTGAGEAEVSYLWQYSDDGQKWHNSIKDGADTDTLVVPTWDSIFATRTYRCVVTTSDERKLTSEPVHFAQAEPAFTVTVSCASVICGQQATFTADVQGASGDLTYKWQYSDDGQTWKTSTSTEATCTVKTWAAVYDTRVYRCTVTDAEGNVVTSAATPFNKDEAEYTVSVTCAPVACGQQATFTADVQGATGDLAYKWQYSDDNGQTWKTSTSSTTGICTVKTWAAVYDTRVYRCTVTDAQGHAVTSEPVGFQQDQLLA